MYASFNDFKTYAEKFKLTKNVEKIDTTVSFIINVKCYGN